MDPTTHLDGPAFDNAFDELVETVTALRPGSINTAQTRGLENSTETAPYCAGTTPTGSIASSATFGSMGSIGDAGVGDAEPVLSRAHLLASVLRCSLTHRAVDSPGC